MADRPLWLLDVDGVINAVDPVHDGKPGWNRGIRSGVMSIRWRTKVAEFIAAAHRSGRAEVRWLTTWEELANEELAGPLGLPTFELAGHRQAEVGALDWWKFDIVRREVPDDRPLIWTDDDLASAERMVPGLREWIAARTGPKLLISPDWHHGLTDDLLAQIEVFMHEHRAILD